MPEPASASDVLPPDNLVFSDLHPRVSNKRTEILSGQSPRLALVPPLVNIALQCPALEHVFFKMCIEQVTD